MYFIIKISSHLNPKINKKHPKSVRKTAAHALGKAQRAGPVDFFMVPIRTVPAHSRLSVSVKLQGRSQDPLQMPLKALREQSLRVRHGSA